MEIALIRFLEAAPDCTDEIPFIDPWMAGTGQGVFVGLPSEVRQGANDIVLHAFICGGGFDPLFSVMACSQSIEVQ